MEIPSSHRNKRAVKSDMNKTDVPFVDLQVDGFSCTVYYFRSPGKSDLLRRRESGKNLKDKKRKEKNRDIFLVLICV
jgi:hypothetical protein